MIHEKYLVLSGMHTELTDEDIISIECINMRDILLNKVKEGYKVYQNSKGKIYVLDMESSTVGAIHNEFCITLS
jgi:hypothetical protein